MSSLFDHGLIRTASVEQVVAPIASHLCLLVLLCDRVEDPEQFSQLEEAAQAVAVATGNMAAVASRYCMEREVYQMENNINTLYKTGSFLPGKSVTKGTQLCTWTRHHCWSRSLCLDNMCCWQPRNSASSPM